MAPKPTTFGGFGGVLDLKSYIPKKPTGAPTAFAQAAPQQFYQPYRGYQPPKIDARPLSEKYA